MEVVSGRVAGEPVVALLGLVGGFALVAIPVLLGIVTYRHRRARRSG
jgi:hypothetical protein